MQVWCRVRMEWQHEGPQMEHSAHSEVSFLSPCTNSNSKSDSASLRKQGGLWLSCPWPNPQQVCGWFNLVAISPTACQVKPRSDIPGHREHEMPKAGKNKQTNKTWRPRPPPMSGPVSPALPSPQATAGEYPELRDQVSTRHATSPNPQRKSFKHGNTEEEEANSHSGKKRTSHMSLTLLAKWLPHLRNLGPKTHSAPWLKQNTCKEGEKDPSWEMTFPNQIYKINRKRTHENPLTLPSGKYQAQFKNEQTRKNKYKNTVGKYT